MLFNSIEFLLFLPAVFVLYWFVVQKNLKIQNLLLLLASYVFYGWWDWRFLSLIAFSSIVDYVCGIQIDKHDKRSKQRIYLIISMLVNLGFLGFFKYFNFFTDSLVDAFSMVGVHMNPRTLNIILPVGISFYTFQTMSYSLDIYFGKMKPTRDIIAFFAFVSFFPQLVAGPIERASNLLPQFFKKREFDLDLAIDGSRQMLWGFFKKIVIADNLSVIVEQCFSNPGDMSSPDLILGLVAFAFQIYCDFSGYSDIAIGVSRLFGFNLMRNFAYPYFSRDIAEFWRRWHISLSTWFRDYLYIPLGGSRGGQWMKVRNTMIIFVVSGFWHGANWTFLVWGALNGLFFLPLILRKKNRRYLDVVAEGRVFPSLRELGSILYTFVLCLIAWTFFRAASVGEAWAYLTDIVTSGNWSTTLLSANLTVWILLLLFILVEWLQRDKQHALDIGFVRWRVVRWGVYYVVVGVILYYQVTKTAEVPFIYFQF